MKKLVLCDGKYTFYVAGVSLYCDRYADHWREFVGDKAVHALFDKCIELQKTVDELRKLVHHYANRAI